MKLAIIFCIIAAVIVAVRCEKIQVEDKPVLDFGSGGFPANIWAECFIHSITGEGTDDESITIYSKEDSLIPTKDIRIGHRSNKGVGGRRAHFEKDDAIYCNFDVTVPSNFEAAEMKGRFWRYPKFGPIEQDRIHLRRTNPLHRYHDDEE